MAALLVGMAVMSIMLSVALPVWRTAVQREREAELIFRGEQYAYAIELFQRRNGGYPPSLDVLEKTRSIRRLYKDPMTGGNFQPVYLGQMIGGQPVVPGQAGRAAAGARGGAQAGRGQAPAEAARGAGAGRGGQAQGGAPANPFTFGAGRAGFGSNQPGIAAAGPIIGVVSTSTADSLRLYNGRGKYNEWAFVATATTQQPGAPSGGPNPAQPGRGGQNLTQPGRGGQRGQPGARPGGPAGPRRGLPFPGRGLQQPAGRGFRGFGAPSTP